MRKRWWTAFGLVAVAAAGFFAIAPGWIEGSMNRIDGKPLIPVSAEARALHATLTIVDLHSDTLMWDRDLLERGTRGHEDLPRMQAGNVALQVFSSVTKTPRGQNYDANGGDTDNILPLVIAQAQPVRTWGSLLQRSLYHGERLDRAVAASDGLLVKVFEKDEFDRLLAIRADRRKWLLPLEQAEKLKYQPQAPVGAMLSIEGLQNLEGDLDNLVRLHAAGFRMAGLTHFFDNDLAGSMHGLKKSGLTAKGREAIARMEALGMIVDIAHCSHACVAEILAIARRPVVSSHGGVQATCGVNRNLSDSEIKGVAATGGIVGIGYWEGAVCSTDPRAAAKAIRHVRDLVGIEHAALGSDYDGATTVRFDTGQLVQVTQALLDEGFTHHEIRAVMGGNALRVLRAGIVPAAGSPA